MLGFKSIDTATKTVSGIEIMYMVHKGQFEGIRCAQSEMQFISEIMTDIA